MRWVANGTKPKTQPAEEGESITHCINTDLGDARCARVVQALQEQGEGWGTFGGGQSGGARRGAGAGQIWGGAGGSGRGQGTWYAMSQGERRSRWGMHRQSKVIAICRTAPRPGLHVAENAPFLQDTPCYGTRATADSRNRSECDAFQRSRTQAAGADVTVPERGGGTD